VDVHGIRALEEHIAKVQRKRIGHVMLRTSEVDQHHSMCRFSWCVTDPAGHRKIEGVDLAMLRDGKVCRVIGFFGPMPLYRTSNVHP
jgi:hypothetical protein